MKAKFPYDKIEPVKKGKKGGKFIAKGTSGCVVTPNYRCEPADEVSQDKVSKIFRTEDSFKTEIKESNVFKTIDPTGKYFFKIHQSCEFNTDLNKKQIELENDLLNCDGNKYMYIANNAGIDLTKPDFKSKEEFVWLYDGFSYLILQSTVLPYFKYGLLISLIIDFILNREKINKNFHCVHKK